MPRHGKKSSNKQLSDEETSTNDISTSPAPALATVTPASQHKLTKMVGANLAAFAKAAKSPKTPTTTIAISSPTPAAMTSRFSQQDNGPFSPTVDDPQLRDDSPPSSPRTQARNKASPEKLRKIARSKRDRGQKLKNFEVALLAANGEHYHRRASSFPADRPDEGPVEQPMPASTHGRSDEDPADSPTSPQHADEPSQGESDREQQPFGNPDSESEPSGEEFESDAEESLHRQYRHFSDDEDQSDLNEHGEISHSQKPADNSEAPGSHNFSQDSQPHSQRRKRARSGSGSRRPSPKRRTFNDRHQRSPDPSRQHHSRNNSRERDHPFSDSRDRQRNNRPRDSQRSDSRTRQTGNRDSQRSDSRTRQDGNHDSRRSPPRSRRSNSRNNAQRRSRHDSRDRDLRSRERDHRSHSRDPYYRDHPTNTPTSKHGPEYWLHSFHCNNPEHAGRAVTWFQVAQQRWDFARLLLTALLEEASIDRPTLTQHLHSRSHSEDYALEHYTTSEMEDAIATARQARDSASSVGRNSTHGSFVRVSGTIPVLTDSQNPDVIETWCEKVTMEWKGGKRYSIEESVRDSTLESLKILFAGRGIATDVPEWYNTQDVPFLVKQLRLAFPLKGAASSTLGIEDTLKRTFPVIGAVPSYNQIAKYVSAVTAVTTAGRHLGSYNQRLAANAIMNNIIARRDAENNPRNVTQVAQRLYDTLKATIPPIGTVQDMLTTMVKIISDAERVLEAGSPWLPTGFLDSAATAGSASVPNLTAGRNPTPGRNNTLSSTVIPDPVQANKEHRVNPRNHCNYSCFGCGKFYQGDGVRCTSCTEHPDRNMEDCPFIESKAYHAQVANPNIFCKTKLFPQGRVDGTPFTPAEQAKIDAGKAERRARTQSSAPSLQGNGNNRESNRAGGDNNNGLNSHGSQRAAHRVQRMRTQPDMSRPPSHYGTG